MIYRDFQGLKLSMLGFGAMRLPVIDGDDDRIDEEAALRMVDKAMLGGINYYDTAWGYHGENSELVMGKALGRYPRESYYIATKHGIASEHTERYFNARAFELGMYAFRTYDQRLFQEAEGQANKWIRKPSASLQRLFFIMRHKWLWRIALLARKGIVSAKQALR